MAARPTALRLWRRGLAAAIVSAGLAGEGGAVSPAAELPVERLKRVYLGCERAATGGVMGAGDAMLCSRAYEDLKRRAFGGDARKLRAWWREQTRDADLAW